MDIAGDKMGLCKKCLGCNRLEDKSFKFTEECNDYVIEEEIKSIWGYKGGNKYEKSSK